MDRSYAFLQLIRWGNVLFVGLLTIVLHQFVVVPLCASYGVVDVFPILAIILLFITTTAIAAGGAIVNDYFDVKIDRINRPESVIITKVFSKGEAMRFFYATTAVGILSGLSLAWIAQNLYVAIIVLLVPGLLWFYSAAYKRQFIVGNLIIAFIYALLPIFIGLVDINIINHRYASWVTYLPIASDLFLRLGSVSTFCFVMTLVCEIIKDLQDIEGDREMECHTLPVVLGVKKTKIIVIILLLVATTGCLGMFRYVPFSLSAPSCQYLLLCVIVPLLAAIWRLVVARIYSDFKYTYWMTQFVLLTGIGLLILIFRMI